MRKKDNWRLNKNAPAYIKREDEHLWPAEGNPTLSAFIPDKEYQAKREAQAKFEAGLEPAPGAARE